MVLLHRTVRNHMVNKPTLIQIIAINFSCAQMERWRWKHAKMVFCSMARVTFTITAITIGPSTAAFANTIVSYFIWDCSARILICYSFFQLHQFHRLAVSMHSASIPRALNAQPATWNVRTVNHISSNVMPVWPMMNASMDATGPINYFIFAIQKVIYDRSNQLRFFSFKIFCLIFSRRWIHMPNKNRWTIGTLLAIPTIRYSWRSTSSHHMRWRTSTSHFVRRRLHFQRRITFLPRTLNSNVFRIHHWKILI